MTVVQPIDFFILKKIKILISFYLGFQKYNLLFPIILGCGFFTDNAIDSRNNNKISLSLAYPKWWPAFLHIPNNFFSFFL